MQTLDLEDAILRDIAGGEAVSLETALLVVSGLKDHEEIGSYQRKIDEISDRFVHKCRKDSFAHSSKPPLYWHPQIAKCLFEYLWNSKPKRFGDSFLLTEAVDAQLDSDVNRSVGTCIGLTSLYSVLGVRAGLTLSLLTTSDHVLSRLRVGEHTIDMDHTDPQGFDYRNGKAFFEFPLLTLVANVLNSRGLRLEGGGKFNEAKADYHKAILLNPRYASAYNNRGNMRFREEDMEGAIADYTKAIKLNPSLCEAYCNRGMAKQRLGHYQDARRDYHEAMAADSRYGQARQCLEILNALEPLKLSKDKGVDSPGKRSAGT